MGRVVGVIAIFCQPLCSFNIIDMPFKRIAIAVCAMFVLAALALCWFVIASNYSDAAAFGTYKLSHEGLSSNLNLRPDHTFTQEIRDSQGARSTKGTWRRFGEAGIHFSEDFLTLPGQQGGEEDGSAYAQMEKDLGILIRLSLPTHEVVWYGRIDRSTTDQVIGRYETSGTHPRTLVLNSDHSFEQHEAGWKQTGDAKGTWSIAHNGDVVFSKEFLKPSGQPLAEYETAKAMDPRGAYFIQVEIADQKYKLSYRKKQLPWQ